MKKRIEFELKRKFIHLFSLLFILVYILIKQVYDNQIALLALIFIFVCFIIMEFFRINQKKRIPFFYIFWRKREKNRLASHIYFILGAIISFAVFDLDIALAALLMTTFGDLAAAITGIFFGKHWLKYIPNTAWEGIIAEFIVDVIVCWFILGNWLIVIPMALVATFVETVFTHADDNLAIPVFSGFIGQILKLLI